MRRDISCALAAALLLAAFACAEAPDTSSGGTWVGTITTEGNVTTVVNESGSVWGGTAMLVEEASIGVEAGADAYMLGRIPGLAASADRIYLIDSQVPALRVYDWNGGHVGDFGREGEGPGEYRSPQALGIDGEGRIWLHDRRGVILVFSAVGEPVATITIRGRRVGGGASMVVTPDGHGYVLGVIIPEAPSAGQASAGGVRIGMVPYDVEGVAGEQIDLPIFDDPAYLQAEGSGALRFVGVPFYPNGVTALAPSRAMLSGYPDTYRFQLAQPDNTTTVIERAWEPVAVDPGEAAAHHRGATSYLREIEPGWVWGEAEIPATKPAYTQLVPTISGEIWVVRTGRGAPIPGCDEAAFAPNGNDTAPCWNEERVVDAFDADGRYLGEVDIPDDFLLEPLPFIRGDTVVTSTEDDAGTIMVKRYRLVLPGEE